MWSTTHCYADYTYPCASISACCVLLFSLIMSASLLGRYRTPCEHPSPFVYSAQSSEVSHWKCALEKLFIIVTLLDYIRTQLETYLHLRMKSLFCLQEAVHHYHHTVSVTRLLQEPVENTFALEDEIFVLFTSGFSSEVCTIAVVCHAYIDTH